MSKKPFELMAGEQIVLKDDCVSRGGFSAYTDELILTNQRIIWINNEIIWEIS